MLHHLLMGIKNFNSHTHVEYDPLHLRMLPRRVHFNSHTHVEYDSSAAHISLAGANFNSHTHVEYDASVKSIMNNWKISTHTLTWSTTCFPMFRTPGKGFQLTHSRGVRLPTEKPAKCAWWISTHTLTWSTTNTPFVCGKSLNISTHTLTWSTTDASGVAYDALGISTHTLTWSTTFNNSFFDLASVNFNSHTHVEYDFGLCKENLVKQYFNSHTHVEYDHCNRLRQPTWRGFQLTHSRGVRLGLH